MHKLAIQGRGLIRNKFCTKTEECMISQWYQAPGNMKDTCEIYITWSTDMIDMYTYIYINKYCTSVNIYMYNVYILNRYHISFQMGCIHVTNVPLHQTPNKIARLAIHNQPNPFPRRQMPSPTKPCRTKNQLGIIPNTIHVCMLHATHFIIGMGSPCCESSTAQEMFDTRTNTMRTRLRMYHDTTTIHTGEDAPKNCHASKKDGKFPQTTSLALQGFLAFKCGKTPPPLPNNQCLFHPFLGSFKKEPLKMPKEKQHIYIYIYIYLYQFIPTIFTTFMLGNSLRLHRTSVIWIPCRGTAPSTRSSTTKYGWKIGGWELGLDT